MSIALVHDYLVDRGGAEKVFFQMAGLLPEATLFAAAIDFDLFPELGRSPRPVQTSFLQSLADTKRSLKALGVLLPMAMRQFDLSAFEIVVSHSTGFAHHVRPGPRARHICYCHTPPRFLYRSDTYFANQATRTLAMPALAVLRREDRRAAARVHRYLANSANVALRVAAAYARPAEILYPPVDVGQFKLGATPSGRYLVVSRLLRYKRVDLAIQAANAASLPLDVIGDGPQSPQLRAMAGPSVRFLGRLSDDEVRRVLASCEALIVPGEEDFGLTPVEAQASGRPPVVYAAGGAMETVTDGVTGFWFREQTTDSLLAALQRAQRKELDPAALRSAAARFDVPVFAARLREILNEEVQRLRQ